MLIKNAKPITNEKIFELDSWYEKFTSNSFEMKFCDADYWAMRKRLALAEKCINELASLATNFTQINVINKYRDLVKSGA